MQEIHLFSEDLLLSFAGLTMCQEVQNRLISLRANDNAAYETCVQAIERISKEIFSYMFEARTSKSKANIANLNTFLSAKLLTVIHREMELVFRMPTSVSALELVSITSFRN